MANINIKTWDDFCYYTAAIKPEYKKDSAELFSTSDTLRFGDSLLDENENFIGEGTGTRNDPYICGTYYEMRRATGAPNIYYLQLVEDGDDENGYHLYYYPKANKYARHDRSNTTIDFNTASYAGVNTIYIWCAINFNGWTFENLNFFPGANFRSRTSTSSIYNMILLKCHAGTTSTNSTYALFYTDYGGTGAAGAYQVYIRDSIIQVDMQTVGTTSSGIGSIINGKRNSPSMYRCTVSVSGNIGYFALSHQSNDTYTGNFYDCIFNFDIITTGIHYSNSNAKNYLYSCKVTGKIQVTIIDYYTIAQQINNCIMDLAVTYHNEKYKVTTAAIGQCSVSNSDKVTFEGASSRNVTQLNSTDIKSPTSLRSIGFPIGSDEINGESNV